MVRYTYNNVTVQFDCDEELRLLGVNNPTINVHLVDKDDEVPCDIGWMHNGYFHLVLRKIDNFATISDAFSKDQKGNLYTMIQLLDGIRQACEMYCTIHGVKLECINMM